MTKTKAELADMSKEERIKYKKELATARLAERKAAAGLKAEAEAAEDAAYQGLNVAMGSKDFVPAAKLFLKAWEVRSFSVPTAKFHARNAADSQTQKAVVAL
eukprot:SAG31_NODE_2115_length_6416_cov_20.056989_3_plen_102_part_00